MPRLRASSQGLIKIERARKKKGWTKTDDRACREASKIIDPTNDWESEEIKLQNIFASGAAPATWKRFLKGEYINIEAFKAFCQILDLNYLEICKNDLAKYKLRLQANIEEIDEHTIFAKIEKLRKLLDLDIEELNVKKIEKGSIVIKLQSSIKTYGKILELLQNSQLQAILGFPVDNIELETIEPSDRQKWLESLFNNSWQPAENLLATSNIRSSVISLESLENNISQAKIISLTETKSVAMIVSFAYLSDREIQVNLEVYPVTNSSYLPEGLTIEILDESDTINIQEEMNSYIDSVQIPFSFEPEEKFKIKLTLENISIVENLFEN